MSDAIFQNQPETDISSYRDGFKNLVRLVIILGLVVLTLTATLLYYVVEKQPQHRYYARTLYGSQAPMQALPEPNMNMEAVLAWAAQAATDVLTFGFHDIDQRFAQSSKNFSPEGWASFRDAMIRSKLAEKVSNNQLLITAIMSEPPKMVRYGMIDGKYRWIVSLTMIMKIRAGNDEQPKRQKVLLTIVKMPTAESPMGLGIETWTSK